MKKLRYTRILVPVFLALAVVFVAAAGAAPSPAKMVLTRLDLSSAFVSDGATQVTNADVVAGGAATDAQLASWGRIDGYKATYKIKTNRAVANKLMGPIYIVSSANTYSAAAGAHAAWLVQVSSAKKTAGIHSAKARRVGDESKLFTYTQSAKVQGVTVTYLIFLYSWRSGSNTASIMCEGIKGRIKQTAVIKLALKQQSRIKGAYSAG
ncbi:MAG: hypothetical protein ABSC36_03055 [Gaiellaceae bacterium]|jgi:hypothetical protein